MQFRAMDLMSISIHAPVKGATLKLVALDKRMTISIHAPVKGATERFDAQRLYS